MNIIFQYVFTGKWLTGKIVIRANSNSGKRFRENVDWESGIRENGIRRKVLRVNGFRESGFGKVGRYPKDLLFLHEKPKFQKCYSEKF